MARVRRERARAEIAGDFVVFLVGMRFNKPWKVHRWLPVFVAMPRMLSRLARDPEQGLLGYRILVGGRGVTVLQYWRSLEQLERFARAPHDLHLPAWRAFNRDVGTGGDVGVWHETFPVRAASYDAVYTNMPLSGLALAAERAADPVPAPA